MTSLTLDKYGDAITIEEFRGLPLWVYVCLVDLEQALRSAIETKRKALGTYRVFVEYHYICERAMFRGIWLQRDIEIYGPGSNRHMIGFVEVKGEIENES
jgi:hypothetical protein